MRLMHGDEYAPNVGWASRLGRTGDNDEEEEEVKTVCHVPLDLMNASGERGHLESKSLRIAVLQPNRLLIGKRFAKRSVTPNK